MSRIRSETDDMDDVSIDFRRQIIRDDGIRYEIDEFHRAFDDDIRSGDVLILGIDDDVRS